MALGRLKEIAGSTQSIVNKAFERAVAETGAVIDGETAQALKQRTAAAAQVAGRIGSYLGDLNGDGKVDVEDLKVAAQKAGIAWEKIDPDLKSAMLAGGVAGVGINFVPLIGQTLAVPVFATTTAYFFLVSKLRASAGGKAPRSDN